MLRYGSLHGSVLGIEAVGCKHGDWYGMQKQIMQESGDLGMTLFCGS